jgi:hypothetical protein
MAIEIVAALLTIGVSALGYMAKTLHNMDKNLSIVVTKLEVHGEDIRDLQTRVRELEIN